MDEVDHNKPRPRVSSSLHQARKKAAQSHKTPSFAAIEYGRQQAAAGEGRFGDMQRGLRNLANSVQHRSGLGGLSKSEAARATRSATEARSRLNHGGANAGADNASGRLAKRALADVLLVGPGARHKESQNIHEDIGSRALMSAEDRSGVLSERINSAKAHIARKIVGEGNEGANHHSMSVMNPMTHIKRAAFRAAHADQHRGLAEEIRPVMQELKRTQSDAYKEQSRADSAEAVANAAGMVSNVAGKVASASVMTGGPATGTAVKSVTKRASSIAGFVGAFFASRAGTRFGEAARQSAGGDRALQTALLRGKAHENFAAASDLSGVGKVPEAVSSALISKSGVRNTKRSWFGHALASFQRSKVISRKGNQADVAHTARAISRSNEAKRQRAKLPGNSLHEARQRSVKSSAHE